MHSETRMQGNASCVCARRWPPATTSVSLRADKNYLDSIKDSSLDRAAQIGRIKHVIPCALSHRIGRVYGPWRSYRHRCTPTQVRNKPVRKESSANQSLCAVQTEGSNLEDRFRQAVKIAALRIAKWLTDPNTWSFNFPSTTDSKVEV